ncbi:putative periplasmic protein [hydrothermal vent metagenome]|uniref:Putative periplasmic protein n=1 Tax=hydrothermal vent metagenome TaxID=652676 RepID=A0A1W1CNG1_9ZZZZ
MIRENLRTVLLGILTILLIYLYFFSLTPAQKYRRKKEIPILNTQYEEEQALNYLNKLRQGAGLIPFSSNTVLNKATKNHASYLIRNSTYGHYEEANKSGFTGEFASQRVKYTGYNTELIIENVSSNNRNYKTSIDGLFAAIYHRLAFLDFQGDEIGISVKQNINNKKETAFVYNIGSSALNQLYKNSKKPSKIDLNNALNKYKESNSKIVVYPFNKQTDVPPVFFNELPDPLPNYDVSGFPISISFNQALFKNIKFLNFELFNSQGKHINNTIVYNSKTDPNRRLNKFSFVLFPLDRLEWNSYYSVKFLAIVDKKLVEKKWSFKTRKYNIPLYKIEDESKTISIKVNEPNLFYFPPKTGKDLLHNVRYNSNFNMEFIDKNTLKLTALKESLITNYLKIGQHELKLNIQK